MALVRVLCSRGFDCLDQYCGQVQLAHGRSFSVGFSFSFSHLTIFACLAFISQDRDILEANAEGPNLQKE